MEGGSASVWACYYMTIKNGWKPSEFANLPPKEKALVIAFVLEKKEEEKKNSQLLTRNKGKKR